MLLFLLRKNILSLEVAHLFPELILPELLWSEFPDFLLKELGFIIDALLDFLDFACVFVIFILDLLLCVLFLAGILDAKIGFPDADAPVVASDGDRIDIIKGEPHVGDFTGVCDVGFVETLLDHRGKFKQVDLAEVVAGYQALPVQGATDRIDPRSFGALHVDPLHWETQNAGPRVPLDVLGRRRRNWLNIRNRKELQFER